VLTLAIIDNINIYKRIYKYIYTYIYIYVYTCTSVNKYTCFHTHVYRQTQPRPQIIVNNPIEIYINIRILPSTHETLTSSEGGGNRGTYMYKYVNLYMHIQMFSYTYI
jgi:hypothetical protein